MVECTSIVSSDQHGLELISYLSLICPNLSKKSIKRAVEQGCCRVNGVLVQRSGFLVSKNDQLFFSLIDQTQNKREKPMISLLYEDDSLLLISKPVDVISSQEDIQKIIDREEIYLTHRLDKETSGVLILAKNRKMQIHLSDLFRQRAIKKTYLALLIGAIMPKKGSIDLPLIIVEKGAKQGAFVRVARPKEKNGPFPLLSAKTDWEVLASSQNHSFVKLFPTTGRTHQIRVHMSSLGHPLLGERKYLPSEKMKYYPICRRHMLHAFAIQMIHPITKKALIVYDPIPTDFLPLIESLFGITRNLVSCELL